MLIHVIFREVLNVVENPAPIFMGAGFLLFWVLGIMICGLRGVKVPFDFLHLLWG